MGFQPVTSSKVQAGSLCYGWIAILLKVKLIRGNSDPLLGIACCHNPYTS